MARVRTHLALVVAAQCGVVIADSDVLQHTAVCRVQIGDEVRVRVGLKVQVRFAWL